MPYRFDRQASAILLAAGFEPEFYPAQWEDVGGPESGPKLSGHPDTLVYSLVIGALLMEVVVADDAVEVLEGPADPLDGW